MTGPAGPWLDDVDRAILDELRAAYALADPPPADLDDRVLFAIELDGVDIEVARLAEEAMVGSGARAAERTRTVTFDSGSLTVMVAVADVPDDRLRLDGWLAPASALRVELRAAGAESGAGPSSRQTTADETGRFVFDAVGHGLVQLLVHRPAGGAAASVVTPSFML